MANNNDELRARLRAKLKEKIGVYKPCAVCGTNDWDFPDAFANLQAVSSPKNNTLGGRVLPSLPLICGNCGNTVLINLLFLGFEESELPNLAFKSSDGDKK